MNAKDQSVKVRRKVHRSPNYPSISLGDAIEKARQIEAVEKRTAASADTILAHLGYKPGVGPGLRALSALRQYGLLEEHGGLHRISETAFNILKLSESSPERLASLKEAAKRPTLVRQVLEFYKDGLPSDLNLRDHLIRVHSFNPESVATFIKALRETVELAKLGPEDHNEPVETQGAGADWSPGMTEQVQQNIKTQGQPAAQGERELFRFPLSQGSSVRILVSGAAGPREIDKLIRLLQLQKEVMQEDDGQE